MIGKSVVLVFLFLSCLDICESLFLSSFRESESGDGDFVLPNGPTSAKKAAGWLLSRRRIQYGWGAETPRAIVALASTGVLFGNNDDLLMRQELFVDIALDLLKNDSQNQIPLHRLAQHIRSLIATCQDPERFYGRNLVQELRSRTTKILDTGEPVLPSLVLTLCLANKIEDNDTYSLDKTIQSRIHSRKYHKKYDVEAYSSIASACLMQRSGRHQSFYDGFFNRMNATVHGFLSNIKQGDVYTVALLFQALNAWSSHPLITKLKDQKDYLRTLLLSLQETDGSFGDILATYYAMPAIVGRSIIDLYTTCSNGTEPHRKYNGLNGKSINIEIILWVMRNGKIESNCINFAIEATSTLFDAMLWAASMNPMFRFKVDSSRSGISIYEIDGIPNDIEKMLYWKLYQNPPKITNVDINTGSKMQPLTIGLNAIKPQEGDKFVFWYKSI